MKTSNLLLWEKWRPKKLDDIILPKRIRDCFENGINKNYIFHGHYGTGKTSLARILIGKYSKDKAFLEINSSLYTSIDILRNDVEKFCRTQPMLETNDPIKYIFLDEFEGVSSQYQDGLKAFVEKYHKNVRFILTTNHINKISDGIKSRFTCIDFDCNDISEEKLLKREFFIRIKKITEEENINISKETIVDIINKNFPDFRSMFNSIDNFRDTGITTNLSNVSNKVKEELYNIIYQSNADYELIYHFIMSRFGPEKIDVMIKILGRNFIDWVIENKKEDISKLFEVNYIISDYSTKLEISDPIVLGLTIVGKIRDIIKS